MGLICPCGLSTDQEERSSHKTVSAGVSTYEPRDLNRKQHHNKGNNSPAEKQFDVGRDSLVNLSQSKGTCCTPKEIRKCFQDKHKDSQRKEQRRSRSTSSNRGKSHHEAATKASKHRHRHRSSEGKLDTERKAVLPDEKEYRGYGGINEKNTPEKKKSRKAKSSEAAVKDRHKHYDPPDVTKISDVGISETVIPPEPVKERRSKGRSHSAKEKTVKEKTCQDKDNKSPRKQRSSAPAYMIPMATGLK